MSQKNSRVSAYMYAKCPAFGKATNEDPWYKMINQGQFDFYW